MTQRHSTQSPGRLTVLAALLAGLSANAFADGGSVVISQVYGGGGNANATYQNDFIELFNRSGAPVSLKGWSIQYASSAGNSWTNKANLNDISLEPGQYYLIQGFSQAAVGAALPAADQVTTINLSGTSGKVALVKSTTALTTANPVVTEPDKLVDMVGFGAANGYEGSGAAPTLSSTLAALRNDGGCADVNDNKTDFGTAVPAARNRGTAAKACSGTGGGTPPAAPIVLNCPATVNGSVGTAFSRILGASDADSIVNAAVITSSPVNGIGLTGFAPATAAGGSASVNLAVAAGLPAGVYPVVVNFSNDAGQSNSCTVNVSVTGQLSIPQIQGSGAASKYANTVQTTTGVITKKLSGGGFFIQDPNGDRDPTTSDAIYVFGTTTAGKVGDMVRVTGTVTEYKPSGATRSYTELGNVTAQSVIGSGYTIVPENIQLPNANLANYEGMLVRFVGPLTVNGNAYLGDRGELVLSNGRRETPTNRYRPGTPEAIALARENDQNIVVLDDGIFTAPAQIPYLADDKTVRTGDTVNDLTGVLDFGAIGGGGAAFKVQPTETPQISRTNVRLDKPEVAAGNVRVASANVLNFFTTFTNGSDVEGRTGQGCKLGGSTSRSNCRGADSMQEFVRQRDKIVNELKGMDADVVGLMEIQNNGDYAVNYLVGQLNAAIGSPAYAVVQAPPATGTDAIRVAMIYKPAVVTPVGPSMSDNAAINNRPPMAQTFKSVANGAKFSLIVNHLKSKGSCGGAGSGDSDSGDGQGCWNATRVLQAKQLTSFIQQVTAAAGDSDVLAVGDFNAYGHEDPITYLNGTGMVSELERFVRPNGTPYSYVFDGTSGYLDHALASASLDAQVAGVTEWHNNADEPEVIDYNLDGKTDDEYVDNAFRASDHDPVVVSLNLAPAFADVTASVKIAGSGATMNRVTGKFSGTITFANTSGKTLTGPLQFVLQNLPAGVTLDGKSGDVNGAPYLTLPATSLAAGASVTVTTTFTNPNKASILYTPKLYTGTF
jgi:predicted extracellular nuclease